ncbi:MAG: cutinase family protein [Corynebacterium sp.]|nr:cutinase family protein [Corynebacterium sp.]
MIKKLGAMLGAVALAAVTSCAAIFGMSPKAEAITCPATYVIAVPGTWESADWDNPYNPTSHPNSFLLGVTKAVQAQAGNRTVVYTLPYLAQFHRVNGDGEATYDESHNEGLAKLNAQLSYVAGQCPGTQFLLMGFSQGAVIVGDAANYIGYGNGPIPADRIKGIALVADGRRDPSAGQFVGNPVGGVGAEVSLARVVPLLPYLNLVATLDPSFRQPVADAQALVAGITMRGPRPGGFGSLSNRTFEICAPNDPVCDNPWILLDAIQRANNNLFESIVHTQYATNPNVIPGTTVKDWLIGWTTSQL